MNRQPMTFGDLASRLAPAPSSGVRCCGPLIASIRSHTDDAMPPARAKRAAWAVLHSISDWEVRMIHAQPLGALQMDVEISLPSGETLRFVLTAGGSKKLGPLYETAAEVVHSGWTNFPYPLAS